MYDDYPLALAELQEMGIPTRRAKAALRRSKGDAMSAAERVFMGDFDDISSDEVSDIEYQSEYDFSGGTSEEWRKAMDPYAGVFFSKDRVEKVIEMTQAETYATVPHRDGKTEESKVRVLSLGEWMNGCPEEGEQSHLFQLYQYLSEPIACPGRCGSVFNRSPANFLLLFPDFSSLCYHLKTNIRQQCPKCPAKICMACGDRVDGELVRNPVAFAIDGPNGKVQTEHLEYNELLHCLSIQAIILGVGMIMIESVFSAAEGASSTTADPKKRKDPPISPGRPTGKVAAVTSSGNGKVKGLKSNLPKGFDINSTKGTGYAGTTHEDTSGQATAEAEQTIRDEKTADLLRQVMVYLPNMNRASGPRGSDFMVHPTVLSHLRRRGGFVNDLLRNDSLLDMSKRNILYRALFDWLEVNSCHESLASMLAMPQMRPVSRIPDPDCSGQITVEYHGAPGPRELLESCVIQATAALKSLRSAVKDPEEEELLDESAKRLTVEAATAVKKAKEVEAVDDETAQLISFCERIITSAKNIDSSLTTVKGENFVKRMKKELPRLPRNGTRVEIDRFAVDKSDDMIVTYEDWAMKARFQYCDMVSSVETQSDGTVVRTYSHAYNSDIQSSEMTNAPKRSLAIAKELAILTRSLPVAWHSSIFLRVDETRVDCIKAMIIGPEGTPYENGCFLFDIWLPMDYNLKPPLVKAMTTNGGKYRYNPNLYADGKVCLSLLGTWAGPGWIPGQSTLLQVLISIQSLILCEEPYLNEPGWADSAGSIKSKAYSANTRRMVLIDAIGRNIREPPKIFESEIKSHFRMKAKIIPDQLDRWKLLDDGCEVDGQNMGSYTRPPNLSGLSAFDKAARTVRTLLYGLDDD